jgi:hypothetical protein
MFFQVFSCMIFPLCYFTPMKDCFDLHRAAPAALAEGAAVLAAVSEPASGRFLKGKIGRLPHAVRLALNQRLHDGQPSDQILPWLNALPEARQVLERQFGGSPITEQNLSQWRHGGHACWLANEQTKEDIAFMEGACRGIDQSKRDALTGQIALVVTARMAVELRQFNEMPEGPAKSEAWEKLVRLLAVLRRGEFFAEKMRVERAKLASLQQAQEVKKAPACEQEQQEQARRIMGLGGPSWNNFTKQWEGEGAAEMTERNEVQRMVVAELLRRKEAKAKEEGKIKKEEAAGDGSGAAMPELPACPEHPGHPEPANISAPGAGPAPSPSEATPELPACPENPGNPEPPPIPPSEAGSGASLAQQKPNLIRDTKIPASPHLVAFRHPRTGALRHVLTTKTENHG